MCNIVTGMDSGIRSSTSGDLDGLTEDGSKGFFDGLLDRRVIGLALPAAVGGAEVTEVDTPTHGVKKWNEVERSEKCRVESAKWKV